jgi:tellurite resistance protein TehA-like permease
MIVTEQQMFAYIYVYIFIYIYFVSAGEVKKVLEAVEQKYMFSE